MAVKGRMGSGTANVFEGFFESGRAATRGVDPG